MLRYVLFDLALFGPHEDPEKARKALLWLLESLTKRNQFYLKDNPKTPKLYQSGVRYENPAQFLEGGVPQVAALRRVLERCGGADDPEAIDALAEIQAMIGGECFRDIPRIIEKGTVDCDNLCGWRCAELREVGVMAMPRITWRQRPDGGYTYHALVKWPDGTEEDPSLILGMGGEDRAKERAEELRKNAERRTNFRDSAVRFYLDEVKGRSVIGHGGGGHHGGHHGGHGGRGFGGGWFGPGYGYGDYPYYDDVDYYREPDILVLDNRTIDPDEPPAHEVAKKIDAGEAK